MFVLFGDRGILCQILGYQTFIMAGRPHHHRYMYMYVRKGKHLRPCFPISATMCIYVHVWIIGGPWGAFNKTGYILISSYPLTYINLHHIEYMYIVRFC